MPFYIYFMINSIPNFIIYTGANAPHIWCGANTIVLTAKYIAKYRSDKSKTTVKENVHSRTSNSTMDEYYNHKTQIVFLYMVRNFT